MNVFLARGGVAVLIAIGGTGNTVLAQASGGTARRDTIVVRNIKPAAVRARLDSFQVLMRAFAEQPLSSEESFRIRQMIESLTVAMRRGDGQGWAGTIAVPKGESQRFVVRGVEGVSSFEAPRSTGWLGITTGDVPLEERILPTGHFVRYFAHPVIISVERNSPAQEAGILAGDSLIAFDGMDVVGRTLNLTEIVTPDRKLGITVRRAGENKEYAVTVVKAPTRIVVRRMAPGEGGAHAGTITVPGGPVATAPAGPPPKMAPREPIQRSAGTMWYNGPPASRGGFSIAAAGLFGASMTTFEATIAEKLNLPAGVLIKDVPEATIAARAGLQPLDVIIGVNGHPVATLPEVQIFTMQNAAERSVTLTIVRDKKQRNLVVNW